MSQCKEQQGHQVQRGSVQNVAHQISKRWERPSKPLIKCETAFPEARDQRQSESIAKRLQSFGQRQSDIGSADEKTHDHFTKTALTLRHSDIPIAVVDAQRDQSRPTTIRREKDQRWEWCVGTLAYFGVVTNSSSRAASVQLATVAKEPGPSLVASLLLSTCCPSLHLPQEC